MKWRIYYADGKTFCDEDGLPSEAPPDGIQVIVQRDPRAGRRIVSGNDFFVWDGTYWIGMDEDGMKTWFRQEGLLKHGLMVCRPRFDELQRLACIDPDFPKKSARYPDEPKVD